MGSRATGTRSATWRFLDSNGAVVASTLSTGLGAPVPDARLRDLPEGLHQVGDELVVSADVPVVGWHVVFTQNRSEFVEPLAGPLQSAGLILVLLLLAVGLTLTVVLARRLRQAREQEARLRALNRSQDEFISVVSHELRTPVSGVLGFLQTSLDHWDVMSDEDRHSAVRRAFTNARRLQAMTRDVLDTESIESGRFGYVRHPMDLADEVRTAVDAFSSGLADGVVRHGAGHPGDDGRRPRPHPAGPREPPRQRAQERAVGDAHRGHPGADRRTWPASSSRTTGPGSTRTSSSASSTSSCAAARGR